MEVFHEKVSTIFRIFICLVNQIITVSIDLRQGNCLSKSVENTCQMS